MLKLNDENLLDTVKTGKHLLIIYKDVCPHCPAVFKIFKELERTKPGDINFAQVDVALCPEAKKLYSIPGVPTVLKIQDGKLLNSWPGLRDVEVYRKIIAEM